MIKIRNKSFYGTFDNIRIRKTQKAILKGATGQLFWTFEFWKFEFVSNFVLRISNLKFLFEYCLFEYCWFVWNLMLGIWNLIFGVCLEFVDLWFGIWSSFCQAFLNFEPWTRRRRFERREAAYPKPLKAPLGKKHQDSHARISWVPMALKTTISSSRSDAGAASGLTAQIPYVMLEP